MSDNTSGISSLHLKILSDVVSAYISNNRVSLSELPSVIANVHRALNALKTGGSLTVDSPEPSVERPTSISIRKSITGGALISFIDGKSYSTLKRHLTKHGLTPDSYRSKFGLSHDYPMVAHSYSEKRSGIAKASGFGVHARRKLPVGLKNAARKSMD